MRISRLAGQLEHALKGVAPAPLDELLSKLAVQLAALPEELPESASSVEECAAALTKDELAELIGQSRAALEHGELAEEALQRLLVALPNTQAERLENALNDFDFERADALLAQLLDPGEISP